MHQTWQNLLFLHWPIDPAFLRPHIPLRLEPDTFDGKAWISVMPFGLSDLHLTSLPPIPGFSSLLELHVRTYVHLDGKPGIWFLSLDASKLLPAIAARVLFMLPHFRATMTLAPSPEGFQFVSKRTTGPAAEFEAHWKTGLQLRDPDVQSLTFFLVERYAVFAGSSDNLTMTRIYHHPWILDEVSSIQYRSSMIAALNLPEPEGTPLAHFSKTMNVEVWEPMTA